MICQRFREEYLEESIHLTFRPLNTQSDVRARAQGLLTYGRHTFSGRLDLEYVMQRKLSILCSPRLRYYELLKV